MLIQKLCLDSNLLNNPSPPSKPQENATGHFLCPPHSTPKILHEYLNSLEQIIEWQNKLITFHHPSSSVLLLIISTTSPTWTDISSSLIASYGTCTAAISPTSSVIWQMHKAYNYDYQDRLYTKALKNLPEVPLLHEGESVSFATLRFTGTVLMPSIA